MKASLETRVKALARRLQPEIKTWQFIVFGNASLAPEHQARIGEQDSIYIKRIHLQP